MPVLRTYCKLKYVFEMEPYLTTITSYNIRNVLAKFRLSSHSLAIETGRHNKIPLSDRICLICNSGEIEDECHIAFHCSLYNNERSQFLTICNITDLQFKRNKLVTLCNLMLDDKLVLYVGLFLKKCLEKRSKWLLNK